MGMETLIGIGLALSAAGAASQAVAASKAKNAMNSAANAELMRQKEYQKKSAGTFDESLAKSGVDTAKTQMDAGQAQALETYKRLQAIPLDVNNGQPQAQYGIVNADVNRARMGLANGQQAAVQGTPQWLQQQQIKNMFALGDQGLIGGFARASAAVNPMEIQAAQRSQDSLYGIGSLLGTAGSLVGSYGANRAPKKIPTSPNTSSSPSRGYFLNTRE